MLAHPDTATAVRSRTAGIGRLNSALSPRSCPAAGGGAPRRLHLDDAGGLAESQELLGGAGREEMHGAGDDAGPAGLVARAEARPVVAVEVLVEQDEVA